MEPVGKLLILVGGLIMVIGIFLTFGWRLPLDLHYQRGNFSFYFPLGTSILISIVLTIIFALLNRGR